MGDKSADLVKKIHDILSELYPDAQCSLSYAKDYELLFSTRLAAQCTDAKVNKVGLGLYKRYQSLEDFANADITELEQVIKPCGLFRTKAADLKNAAKMLLEKYDGKVPDTMEKLLALPGIGRKTANLMLGDLWGKPAIVTDTHCIRISNRLGFCKTKDPYKVELALLAIVPPEISTHFCHLLVFHGRAVCKSQKPNCAGCGIAGYCAKAGVTT